MTVETAQDHTSHTKEKHGKIDGEIDQEYCWYGDVRCRIRAAICRQAKGISGKSGIDPR